MRKAAALVTLLLGASGCLMPPPPAERAVDAARELNLATRFGRMDVALGLTARTLRESFSERRAEWGNQVRILDVELAGLELPERGKAVVQVDVSWTRVDDATLRSTRVTQIWRDQEGGWKLTREQRAAGDLGLFGEPVKLVRVEPRDVHFPSRTLR